MPVDIMGKMLIGVRIGMRYRHMVVDWPCDNRLGEQHRHEIDRGLDCKMTLQQSITVVAGDGVLRFCTGISFPRCVLIRRATTTARGCQLLSGAGEVAHSAGQIDLRLLVDPKPAGAIGMQCAFHHPLCLPQQRPRAGPQPVLRGTSPTQTSQKLQLLENPCVGTENIVIVGIFDRDERTLEDDGPVHKRRDESNSWWQVRDEGGGWRQDQLESTQFVGFRLEGSCQCPLAHLDQGQALRVDGGNPPEVVAVAVVVLVGPTTRHEHAERPEHTVDILDTVDSSCTTVEVVQITRPQQ